jgi:TM2 domain-containing membrane protein YozV
MGGYVQTLPEYSLMQGMTEQQQQIFLGQFNAIRKDVTVGVLLAFFLGSFGAHRFYLGEMGLGILYFVFFWTGIPGLVALIECFFMPGRVREYNWVHANLVATQVRGNF